MQTIVITSHTLPEDLDADNVTNPEVVTLHLERIIASPEFVRSARMVSFLRFVVERTLAHEEESINERAIAYSVFEKPYDWDPTIDTIVRSEGRRLRKKLGQYYEGLGRNDRLRICVPKGTYIPEFVSGEFEPAPKAELPLITRPLSQPQTSSVDAPKSRDFRKFWLYAFFGLLLLLCVVLAVVLVERVLSRKPNNAAGFSTMPFTADFGKKFSPAISPDGRTVAYVWDDGSGTPDIYLRDVDAKTSRRLDPQSDERLYPSWSHDGGRVAFIAVHGDRLAVVVHSIRDGSEKTVATVEKSVGRWTEDGSQLLGCPGPEWSADDRSLIVEDHRASSANGGLAEVDIDGSKRIQLTSTGGESHDLYPRLSPDGRTVAFVRYSSHGVGDVFVKTIGKAEAPRRLTQDQRTIQGLAWSRDGKSLIFSSNRQGSFQLWSVALNDSVITFIPTASSWASEPSITARGNWMIYVEGSNNWNIWRSSISAPGKSARAIASSGRNYDARYSPDGHHIAFASDRSGYMELWLSDDTGQGTVQMTHLRSNWLGGISWSPDGESIAFDARPQGHSAVYVISSKGGEPRALNETNFEERMPAWSSDGRSIYFNSNREGATAIFEHSLQSGFNRLISSPGMFAVTASGSKLFIGNSAGELFQSDADGAHLESLLNLKASPVMSWIVANSGSLYLTKYDPSKKQFNLLRYRDRKTTTVGQMDGMLVPNAPDIEVSRDEKWVLYSRQENFVSDLVIRRSVE